MQDQDLHTLLIYQREYFRILEEFFTGATGQSHLAFCNPSSFSDAIRRLGGFLRNNPDRSRACSNAFENLEKELGVLYAQESSDCFKSAKNIKCCKINLGGSSRFLETQLNATKKSMLISDVILIPDPVMPWLESPRAHEKFKLVHIIQAVYFILHLKDFISDEFDLPPFLVFPSWEKLLEDNDQKTIESMQQMTADFISFYINEEIEKIEDAFEFVDKNENEFLSRVEQQGLFVSPGGEVGESLDMAFNNYIEEIKQWRTKEFYETVSSATKGRVILNGIMERIQPQYHVFENAYELVSNPLLCVDAQAHYFSLLGKMTNSRINNLSTTDDKMQTILSALMSKRLDYLTNINDEQLLELRKSNENVNFRNKLRQFVSNLPSIEVSDLGYSASEICSHIDALISDHQKEVETLNDKYRAKHGCSALIAGGGLAVTVAPALAPFLGAALPIALTAGGKYMTEKLEERHERKILSGSMLGIFALAKKG